MLCLFRKQTQMKNRNYQPAMKTCQKQTQQRYRCGPEHLDSHSHDLFHPHLCLWLFTVHIFQEKTGGLAGFFKKSPKPAPRAVATQVPNFRVRCSILSENYSLRPKLCFFLRICHYFCHLYLFHFWKYSTAAQTRMQIMKNLNKHTNKSRCHTANKILLSCHHTQPDQSFESTINQETVFII